MEIICCFIKKSYFDDNPGLEKMLDPGDSEKQSHRTHVCIKVTSNENDFYIPLRNNLGDEIRKFGRIGHSIPTKARPQAGLDYRHTLVINNPEYIDIPKEQRIPKSQHQKLVDDASDIEAEFAKYLKGFIKAAKKKRVEREALYRESSLINFLTELGVEDDETTQPPEAADN